MKTKLVRKPRTKSLFNTGTRPINQIKITLGKLNIKKRLQMMESSKLSLWLWTMEKVVTVEIIIIYVMVLLPNMPSNRSPKIYMADVLLFHI